MTRETFSTYYARLAAAQKPGAGVPAYTRWVNRPLARYAAAGLAARGVSANGTTAISAGFSALGVAVLALAPVHWATGVVVAALLAVGYVLDSADGQVARLTGTGSPAGEWLDHVVDAVRTPALHGCALIGWYRAGVPEPLLLLPLLFTVVAVGHFMSQILAEQLLRAHGVRSNVASDAGPLRSFVNLPTDAGVSCWIFVFWGAGAWFAVPYGLLLAAHVVIAAASVHRKYAALRALSVEREVRR